MTSASFNRQCFPLLLVVSFALTACGGRGSGNAPENTDDPASGCIGCTGDGDGATSGDGDSNSTGDGDGDTMKPLDFGDVGFGEFKLRPEWDGPCEEASGNIDINLGNSAETTVRSIHCQIYGEEPSSVLLAQWANDLRELEHVRRIDVAWTFCLEAEKACSLAFSDPWESQILLEDTCTRNDAGDIGAVMMFFSECPSGLNCGEYWANTHAVGMQSQHALYGYDTIKAGYQTPKNQGWWRREFLDARWAGLGFLLLNAYGPDVLSPDAPLEKAVAALDDIGGGIGLALMDDTWGWRADHSAPFNQVPDLANTEQAAALIYEHKWKAFFDRIPDGHRYKINGRPLIYFYNAGTLNARDRAASVITRMKQLFAADFGVEPFVVVDSAFFEDEAAMNAAADGRFTWDSFKYSGNESNTLHNITVHHQMTRWDPVGRDRGAAIANADDELHKGPEVLANVLTNSVDADLTVIATWNDLGEGTGINRNYDYFHQGEWLAPHHFLSMIRKSRCVD